LQNYSLGKNRENREGHSSFSGKTPLLSFRLPLILAAKLPGQADVSGG